MASSVAQLTELDMVRDARQVLLADPNTSQAMLDRNAELIERYAAGGRDKWTGTTSDDGAPKVRSGSGARSSAPQTRLASEQQLGWIRRLIDQKLPEGDPIREPTLQAWAGNGPKGKLTGGREGTASALITALLKLPDAKPELANDGQKNLIRGLAARKFGRLAAKMILEKLDAMSKRDASKTIDSLEKLPNHTCQWDWLVMPPKGLCRGCGATTGVETKEPAATAPKPATGAVQDGMYRDPEGNIYKVQVAVHGSGQLYAKRLVKLDEPRTLKNGVRTHDFVYAPGVVRQIKPEWRMTLEEAQAWGKLYGTCCKCGLTLTKETSIERGMGDKCASKGW